MEQFSKAFHEFMGTKPGETAEAHIEKDKGNEGVVPPGHTDLRNAASLWAVWCLLNLEGLALALGLNVAYTVCQFLNHLEGRDSKDRKSNE